MYDPVVTEGYQWSRIGGHLALDLCNTVSWRLDPSRTIERLRRPQDLADWFKAVAAQDFASSADETSLAAVKELRDATIRLTDSHLDGHAAADHDMQIVHRAWCDALAIAQVPPRLPLAAAVEPTAPALLAPYLALAIADLLQRPDLSNLRRCDGDGCGWLFLDATRNHSRRWCDSLDCGNRARVRAYTQRRRGR